MTAIAYQIEKKLLEEDVKEVYKSELHQSDRNSAKTKFHKSQFISFHKSVPGISWDDSGL